MAPTTRATTADDGLTDEVPVPEDLNLMVAEGVHFFLSKFSGMLLKNPVDHHGYPFLKRKAGNLTTYVCSTP